MSTPNDWLPISAGRSDWKPGDWWAGVPLEGTADEVQQRVETAKRETAAYCAKLQTGRF